MRTRTWRGRIAARRLRPGDGTPLPPFRWWQTLTRSVRTVTLPEPDGTSASWAVDVRQLGDGRDGAVRARLYRDGSLRWTSTMPAAFPVPGGHLEVAAGAYGLRRCHLVRDDGGVEVLVPHPASAEGRRERLHRTHPRLSRLLGGLSILLVLAGVAVAVPQLLASLSQVPLVAEAVGTVDLPVRIPLSITIIAALAATAGSVERALRLRSTWLDTLAS